MDDAMSAFSSRPELQARVDAAIAKYAELETLFREISEFIGQTAEPASKKRKLGNGSATAVWDGPQEHVNDVSFGIPQRRKLRLELGRSAQTGLRARNKDGDIDWAVSWADVREIILLPVPDKAQKQWNFCILYGPKGPDLDQALFTIVDGAPKEDTVSPQLAQGALQQNIRCLINEALISYGKSVVEPDDKEFRSPVPQPHRKNEPAYHVKAFRGVKEGYLYLLSIGIVWGFRKPLEFYTFEEIESVSYESILSRTFDLNIALHRRGGESEDVKFGMLDQTLFAELDAYVKAHNLQNASMADERRAQDGKVESVEEAGEEEGGELAKAARLANDQEEAEESEEDENFDPGSEGQSEGEGDSTDEEA